jgi:hypothetical protein
VAAAIVAQTACGESGSSRGSLPPPERPLPTRPAPLARVLADNTRALHAAIDRWRREGDSSRGGPPREVTLRALLHQRIHILLSERPLLARASLRRLPRPLRAEARDLIAARRALVRLTPPTRRRRFRTGPALPAGVLLGHYRSAERRFRISGRVLAAINLVETGFGRLRSSSTAGARGPMQFIPSSWRAYGMGGDVEDPRDAIMGAANYLRASGAPRDYRRALHAYNPSPLYVNAVLRYVHRMRADPRAFYVLYSWQVFVRGRTGLRRITGPSQRG